MAEKSLVSASSIWDTQQNYAWSKRSTVLVTGQDGGAFCLLKPCSWNSCGWKFQLVEGTNRDGPVVLHITKSGYKSTVIIHDIKTEHTTEMRSPSYLHRIREFTWEGETYMWKRSSKLFTARLTYTLMQVGSSIPLAQNAWGSWSWRRNKGCITIFEAGSHLPAHLVVAMGLSMEQLWRDSQHR